MENKQLPDWILDQYLLKELPSWKTREVKKILETNDSKSISKYFLYLSFALASIVLVLILFNPTEKNYHKIKDEVSSKIVQNEEFSIKSHIIKNDIKVRIKGEKTRIFIYRKTNDGFELVRNMTTSNDDDILQLAYITSVDSYGIIFSIDGRGVVTLIFPDKEVDSAKLINGKKVILSNAYKLDDAPGFERFFFIASKEYFDITKVLKKAKELAKNKGKAFKEKINLNNSMTQSSITILKKKKIK
jgi:hypothetical protein